MSNLDKLVSIELASHNLRVSSWTIRQWINCGIFPYCRIGPKLIRLYEIDVLALQEKAEDLGLPPHLKPIVSEFPFPSRLV